MNKSLIVLGIGAVVAAFSIALPNQHNHGQGSSGQSSAGQGMMQGCGGCSSGAAAQKGDAVDAKVVKGVQTATVTVTGGKYEPSAINLKKGMPAEIAFKLGANPGCGDVLVIKDLKLKKELREGKPEVVKFTPKKAGTIDFTCGMGMFRGKLLVK